MGGYEFMREMCLGECLKLCLLVVTVFVFVLVSFLSFSVVGAQDSASAQIGVPERVEVDEEVDIETSFYIPDVEETDVSYLSLQPYVNDTLIETESSPAPPGSNVSFVFDYVFEQKGDYEVRSEATVTLGNEIIEINASESVEVTSKGFDVYINMQNPVYAEVDENTNLSPTLELADLDENQTINVSTSLLLDGERIESRDASIRDGESKEVSFSHVFTEKGNFTPELLVEATVNGEEFEKNAFFNLSVMETDPQRKNIQGMSFGSLSFLEEEFSLDNKSINRTLDKLPIDAADEGLIFSQGEDVFYVITGEKRKGYANISGWLLQNKVSIRDVEIQLFVAEYINYREKTQSTTINELMNSSSEFSQEIVEVDSIKRQISQQINQGDGTESPVTVGYVSESPPEIKPLVKEAIDNGGELIKGPGSLEIKQKLRPGNTSLPVFSYEESYWYNGQAETEAIVLEPGTKIYELLTNSTTEEVSNLLPSEEDKPILYEIESKLDYEGIIAIQAIKQNPEIYEDKVIAFVSKGIGGKISIQETINNVSVTNVTGDILLEGGVSWYRIVDSFEESTLVTLGASSHKGQETIYEPYLGMYTYIGRVVSLDEINELLEGVGLVVYERKNIAESEEPDIEEDLRNKLTNRTKEINKVLLSFTQKNPKEVPTKEITEHIEIEVQGPGELPENISLKKPIEIKIGYIRNETSINLTIKHSFLSKINLLAKGNTSGAEIKIKQINKELTEIPQDPIGETETYRAFELELKNLTEQINEEAEIEFSVPREWFNETNTNQENVSLQRFGENQNWSKLPTNITEENETHISYRANPQDTSVFAVTAEKETEDEDKEEKPLEFVVEELSLSPEINQPGEITQVTVQVTNTGGEEGTYRANLTVNGEIKETQALSISLGETRAIGFDLEIQEPGEYIVKVGEETAELIIEQKESDISITNVSLSKQKVPPEQNITVTVELRNSGEAAGNYTLGLSVNDELIKQRTTEVGPKSTKEVEIDISREKEGTYELDINGFIEEFEVEKDRTPGFSSLVAIVALLIVSLIYKKKNKKNRV
ncbi:hypothetical protein C9439_04435 [archaeon SCG-AAA382B04]|nr:hypothetical protein C9439_04435 [archaeon SCG-AAA382B04]